MDKDKKGLREILYQKTTQFIYYYQNDEPEKAAGMSGVIPIAVAKI
jgi:hypothetical protein